MTDGCECHCYSENLGARQENDTCARSQNGGYSWCEGREGALRVCPSQQVDLVTLAHYKYYTYLTGHHNDSDATSEDDDIILARSPNVRNITAVLKGHCNKLWPPLGQHSGSLQQ